MKCLSGLSTRDGGFTLIEVLVALAIVAIGMAAVLSSLTSSASTVVYMRDKTLANWVALNHIAEQRLGPPSATTQLVIPQLGKTDGDVDFAGQKWHWQQETVATAIQGMVRMDVHVRPADVKTDEDRGWYVTLSGIMGDAVAPPRGDMPMWGPGIEGIPGQNENNPANSPGPGQSIPNTNPQNPNPGPGQGGGGSTPPPPR